MLFRDTPNSCPQQGHAKYPTLALSHKSRRAAQALGESLLSHSLTRLFRGTRLVYRSQIHCHIRDVPIASVGMEWSGLLLFIRELSAIKELSPVVPKVGRSAFSKLEFKPLLEYLSYREFVLSFQVKVFFYDSIFH